MSYYINQYIKQIIDGESPILYGIFDRRLASFIDVKEEEEYGLVPSPFFLTYDECVEYFNKSSSNEEWKKTALLFDINNKEIPLLFDKQITFVIYKLVIKENKQYEIIKEKQEELMKYEWELNNENTVSHTLEYIATLKDRNIKILLDRESLIS